MKPETKAPKQVKRGSTSSTTSRRARRPEAIDPAAIEIARVLFYEEGVPPTPSRQPAYIKRRLGFLPTPQQMQAAEWLIAHDQKAFRDPMHIGERRRFEAIVKYAEAVALTDKRTAKRWVKSLAKEHTPGMMMALARAIIEHYGAELLALDDLDA